VQWVWESGGFGAHDSILFVGKGGIEITLSICETDCQSGKDGYRTLLATAVWMLVCAVGVGICVM